MLLTRYSKDINPKNYVRKLKGIVLHNPTIHWLFFSRFGFKYRSMKFLNFESIIDDYVEFSGEARGDILRKIDNSLEKSAKDWADIVKSHTPDEVEKFYFETDYIQEIFLAYVYWKRFRKKETIIKIVDYVKKNVSGSHILEYMGYRTVVSGFGGSTLVKE